jgi:NADP-dependent 3-hydroxy acid dehydrogenase YdfG
LISLKGKLAFVTGASSGIGKACAKAFAEQGCRLLLCARRLERIEELASELKAEYQTQSHCFSLDVRERASVESFLEKLPEEWREIDILVNNAGLAAGLDKAQSANADDWDQMIDTNIKGLLYITRSVAQGMIDREWGHIINIGSTAGHEVYSGGSVYCATKHAVRAITKGLLLDLVDTPVRVSSVDPGMVETEFSMVRFKGDQEKADKVYQGMDPLTPQDIADAVMYCATRPPNVNVSNMVVLAAAQGAATVVHRK